MAEYTLPPDKDMDIQTQFREILYGGLTAKNVNEKEFFILTSPNGTKYRLIIDDSGNLSTKEV
jgi:hypothetical protein